MRGEYHGQGRYKGDPIGDLRKAREYLDREIARMEREGKR